MKEKDLTKGYFIFTQELENLWISQDRTAFLPSVEEIDRIVLFLISLKAKGQDAIDKYNHQRQLELEKEAHNYQEATQIKIKQNPVNRIISGYIYFLGGDGYVKIGKAKKLYSRIASLELLFPFEVKLLHTIKSNDINKDEVTFHKMFSTKRTNGEWFKLDEDDVAKIKTIQELT